MATINKKEYEVLLKKIEELLKVVDNNTPDEDANLIELNVLSKMVEEYEDVHFPIQKPSLSDVLKLRMYEMKLTQKSLAEIIGISASGVSEIISEKREPTLTVARNIIKKLNIEPSIVLGLD